MARVTRFTHGLQWQNPTFFQYLCYKIRNAFVYNFIYTVLNISTTFRTLLSNSGKISTIYTNWIKEYIMYTIIFNSWKCKACYCVYSYGVKRCVNRGRYTAHNLIARVTVPLLHWNVQYMMQLVSNNECCELYWSNVIYNFCNTRSHDVCI